MKNAFGHVLMAPDTDGGAGGGADGKGADDKGDGADNGKSLLDEGGSGDGAGDDGKDGGDGKDADGKGGGRDDGASGSLLAGDGADGGDGKGADGKKPDGAPEATPEQIDAYLAKIKKIDFSDGGEAPAPAWDDGALKTVAPLFIKHKIGDGAANEIIAAYGRHVAGQYKAAAEADRQVLAGLRAECSKRFGGDIRRFASEGRRGGEHVFGKELFSRLARVEAFGSDPDIIEALAKIGRGLTPDGAAGGGTGDKTEKSLAERMYPKGK